MSTNGFDIKHRSRLLLDGPSRAGARAQLKGIGYDDEALAKPIIGVASTWIETMPCNFHLRALAAKVKEGIRDAGGTPMELNTIAISDGITMGTTGMKTSLVSREVIADSIELVARGHFFDGVIALSGCDKTIPGTVMALCRLDVPSVMLYGGSIPPGHFMGNDVTIGDVYEAIGAHATGRMSDEDFAELESVASPGAGACGGQFTANTMAMAFEVLGISPMGQNLVPAQDPTKAEVAYEAGKLVVDVLRRGLRPSEIITKEALENAIAGVACSGGSTNAVLHLLAVAREIGVELDIDDFDRVSQRTPLLCDLKPAGRYVAVDLYKAGGVPVMLQRLQEAGLLNEDTITVTGETIGELAAAADETEGQRVVRALDEPAEGHRRPGHPARQPRARGLRHQARRPREAPPRGARARLRRRGGGLRRGHQWPDPGRRRGRHPQRGPGRRARHARDARRHRRHQRRRPGGGRGAADRRALLRRHARVHDRPRRARGRARRPDRGHPRRRRHHHRRRRARRMDVALDDDEIARRVAAYEAPENHDRTGVLAKYAALVGSASEGAVTLR